MDKLFFDRARAIEAGEMTAPPEVIARPRTPLARVLHAWKGLALHQQAAFVIAAALLAAAAVVMF